MVINNRNIIKQLLYPSLLCASLSVVLLHNVIYNINLSFELLMNLGLKFLNNHQTHSWSFNFFLDDWKVFQERWGDFSFKNSIETNNTTGIMFWTTYCFLQYYCVFFICIVSQKVMIQMSSVENMLIYVLQTK